MTKDKTNISGAQLIFTIIIFMQAASLLKGLYFTLTGHDSWMIFIQSFILYLPILFMLFFFIFKFPDKNLIDINNAVFGKIGGKIVSFFYLLYFITLCSLHVRDLGGFTHDTILKQTPPYIVIALFVAVCAYAVRYGIDVVTRGNSLFAIVSIAVTLISLLLLSNMIHLDNFAPMLDLKLSHYLMSSNLNMSVPFGELILFMMITPRVRTTPKRLCKHFFIGFAVGALCFLLTMMRDISVLGNTIELFKESSFESLRLINIDPTVSRVEILYSIVFVLLLFAKISFVYYCVVIAFAQIFNVKRYQNYIISLGLLITVYSLFIFKNQAQYEMSAINFIPFYFMLFQYILPIVTFVVTLIKKPYKRSKAA